MESGQSRAEEIAMSMRRISVLQYDSHLRGRSNLPSLRRSFVSVVFAQSDLIMSLVSSRIRNDVETRPLGKVARTLELLHRDQTRVARLELKRRRLTKSLNRWTSLREMGSDVSCRTTLSSRPTSRADGLIARFWTSLFASSIPTPQSTMFVSSVSDYS